MAETATSGGGFEFGRLCHPGVCMEWRGGCCDLIDRRQSPVFTQLVFFHYIHIFGLSFNHPI